MSSDTDTAAPALEAADADDGRGARLGATAYLRALIREPVAAAAATFLLVMAVVSLGADWVAPYDPTDQNLRNRLQAPFSANNEGGLLHILGTDELGRDVLSRVLHGGQVSISVGLVGALVSGAIGVVLGLVAGYRRGVLETVIMRLVDGMLALPSLLIALIILFLAGAGFWKLILVFALLRWMVYARMTRGLALAYRDAEFVRAATAVGARSRRVMFRHLLPNFASPLLVLGTLEVAFLILSEASLSFLGFGIQPPNPSWGLMIANGREYLQQAWWIVTFPGVAIMLCALSLNLVATWFRSATDPQQRWRLLNPVRHRATAPSEPPDAAAPAVQLREQPATDSAGDGTDGAEPEALLEVRDLHVRFETPTGRVHAVRGVDLSVNRGDTIGILGESGCGKSATMQAIMRILPEPPARVSATTMRYRDVDLLTGTRAEVSSVRGTGMSMVFQDALTSLNPALRVGYQIGEVYRARTGASRSAARRHSIDLLARVGIPAPRDRIDDYPHQFSGGMRQRAMIATALAMGPELLIADEPTTALDVTVQRQILDLLADLQDEFGMALVLITHDLGVLAEVVDQIHVMYAGEIVESGPVADLYRRPLHPYTSALMASNPQLDDPAVDLIPIEGTPPQLMSEPVGCPFEPRCEQRRDDCRLVTPTLRGIGEDHASACLYAEELVDA
ncbi:MAG: dipeptide/oligopeptide/nickel ABC transporter permease/ATP-binding protein [Acidimicrobiaceae bacterium]|nr:dipeptide/oligopeptide/nickel ABC transporter permease/ATP-binding protein [Acidimicrobiaceae bacterium]MYL03448.1 dipeptide/oligopeptide/nickel ABC transporter permease/ATP-binding protein [Acidimicrobiaceae bacterium]